jgi:hypothetical protein
MPPKKQGLNSKLVPKSVSKLKVAGASGMQQFHISEADKFQMFLSEVNKVNPITGNPHPNKVELDKVRSEYMDWYMHVDLNDLEMAYYGLLFSTGNIFKGANEITDKFEALLEKSEPDSYLEYYKLVIMGNWIVKNNRLDVKSYTKLLSALASIHPGDYVVCPESTDILDLHSSLCYLNHLLHQYNPDEYSTDLLPNDCPPLAMLPPTQGAVNQAKLNNAARQAIKQGTMSYSKVAAIPKPETLGGAAGNNSKPKKSKKNKPLSSYTARELKEYYAKYPERRIKKKDPKKEAKRLAKLQARDSGKPAPQEEHVVSPEEADERLAAKADKNSIKLSNTGSKILAAENRYAKHLIRSQKRINKQVKRAHGEDLHNLKQLINRVKENANKALIDRLLGDYGHLLDDTELINEYLNEIYRGEEEPEDNKEDIRAYEKREHHRHVIEDARGLLNKFKLKQKMPASAQANSAKQVVTVVTETPKPANNAPKTIQEAANVISNSYETESESESETDSEADMREFARPVYRLQQGRQVTTRTAPSKGGNLNAARRVKAQESKARSKKANNNKKGGRSKKGKDKSNN